MSKLNNRNDVIERYWPDYISNCMRSQDNKLKELHKDPTEDGFWLWYITSGPMGLNYKGLFYNQIEEVKYL